ncbi:hypothetical protein ACKFRL_06660 [Corynebacterium marquesiae]|uniref:hypothetical protein n=1 Tax=Corynebacterium TaxID=1716 RepID=UPI002025CEF8|nr:hypothetical protein [Corynebacterium tuberculostearicum]MCG7459853.1 hypothetical protein [Corynebacterium tuberculostearicum]
MSRSKNSPQQDGEEQSSQISSWWAIALIALCTVTTTLDKRKPHPSTAPTELQDKQTKRGKTEPSTSDKKHVWDKWNPQTGGNFSLVLIQGALFALFQIVGPDESLQDKAWSIAAWFSVLLVGLVIFWFATTMEKADIVIAGVLLMLFTLLGALASLQKIPTGLVIFSQIAILMVAWWASESLKGPNQKWIGKGVRNG